MTLGTLLSWFAAWSASISSGFLVNPAFWIRLYGATADDQARFLYRLIGAVFGGLAVMAWTARTASNSPARHAIMLGLLVVNLLAAGVACLGAATGVYNVFAWAPTAVFAAFTVGFARCTMLSGRVALSSR